MKELIQFKAVRGRGSSRVLGVLATWFSPMFARASRVPGFVGYKIVDVRDGESCVLPLRD
jgi:hypothetical protein